MSLPVRLKPDAVNLGGLATLLPINAGFNLNKAWISAFCDNLADFVCPHAQYTLQLVRHLSGLFDDKRVRKNGITLVARGKHPTTTIKNHTTLRFESYPPLSLT
jgi:hypothetical protein